MSDYRMCSPKFPCNCSDYSCGDKDLRDVGKLPDNCPPGSFRIIKEYKYPLDEFQKTIKEAYKDRNRDVIEATGMLQCEAAELAEIFLKAKWYNKNISRNQIISEAGDILNFLVFILQSQGLTLEQAMENNIHKLKERGWLNNAN